MLGRNGSATVTLLDKVELVAVVNHARLDRVRCLDTWYNMSAQIVCFIRFWNDVSNHLKAQLVKAQASWSVLALAPGLGPREWARTWPQRSRIGRQSDPHS
jgi:hypothetical protein